MSAYTSLRRSAAALAALTLFTLGLSACGGSSEPPRAAPVRSSSSALQPTVSYVTPSWQSTSSWGQTVTLGGQNFEPGARVFFGGNESPWVSVLDPQTLRADSPELTAGVYDIVVQNPGLEESTLVGAYTVSAQGIVVYRPMAGETLMVGDNAPIQWNSEGVNFVSIELWREGAFVGTVVGAWEAWDGWVTLPLPAEAPAGPGYTIRVADLDGLAAPAFSAPFTLEPPRIDVTAPSEGTTWNAGSNVAIYWHSPASMELNSARIELWSGGELYTTLTPHVSLMDGYYGWSIPGGTPVGSDYTIRIVDDQGLMAPASSATFSIVPPPGSTVTALAVSDLTPVEDVPVTLTATVTSGGLPVPAGGLVYFYADGSMRGSGVTNALGVATYTVADFSYGSHTAFAAFAGNVSFQTSTSTTATIVVSLPDGSAVTNITVSGGNATYTSGGGAVVVDPGVVVTSGGALDTARVFVSSGFVANQDVLAFPGAPGITGSYDAAAGVLSLSGSATAADYQAALRTVTYANTAGPNADVTPRVINFSLGSGLLYAGTGHFYKYVAAPAIRWDTARDVAAQRRYFGLVGYLATVTSAGENQFIQSKLRGNGWMGASAGNVFTVPRTWSWVTGPEAGTPFFTQTGMVGQVPSGGGTPIGGQYNNWRSGEPNTYSNNENYAHFYSNDGTWNDFAINTASISGYVVEFGGTAGDPTPVLSGVRSLGITIPTYTVTFQTDGTSGASLTGSVSQSVNGGANAAPVTAVPPATHYFSGWTGTGGFTSAANPVTVTAVPSDMTMVASFAPKAAQSISFSLPAGHVYGEPALELAGLATGGGSGQPVTFSIVSGPGSISGTQLTFTGAGTIVVAAHQAGSTTFLAAPDAPASIVVGKATATVSLGSLAQPYTGTARAATATTSPAGLTVALTYDGSATAPTAAGSYAVVGTIVDDDHQGSASGTLVVGKGTATVTLGSLAQSYSGSTRPATATTSPAGLTVTFTYDGGATAPTAVGSYAVVGTIVDSNWQGSASGTLVVGKGTATVTLASLAQTYTGAARSATATTSPAGLTVDLTYDGSATAPTAVGSYAVVGTIDDASWQGSASGTLVIGKATATVTLASLAQTYNGSARAATASTTPAGLTVDLTYDGSATAPTASGTYAVVGTISDANYQGSSSGSLVVSKATATVTLGALAQTYTGAARIATATTSPAGLAVDLTYDGSATAPTAAGTYAVVGTINDANYAGSASGSLVVSKASATVTLGSLAQTYNLGTHPATATTSPAGLTVTFTYDGSATAPTNAGTYAVVGTIVDANHAGSASGSLVVAKSGAGVNLAGLAQTYDGTPRTLTATTTPAGLTVTFTYNGSATAPTNAGSYGVLGTIVDANYQGSGAGTLVVSKAAATVTLGALAQTYNGSARAATATTSPAGLTVGFTYDGSATAPTAAGTYAVVGTISDTNHAGTAAGSLVVGKAAATVTLGSLAQTYNGSARAATATTTPAGLTVDLTYEGSATAPTASGTYAVVGTINDSNYAGSTSGSLVVGKATATVTLGALAQTYDGSARAATATTSPAGLTVGVTYDGGATAPTDAGSYAVVATINDANHAGSASGTLVVGKAAATVILSSLLQTYDGGPHPVTATTVPAGLAVTFTYDGGATAPTDAGSYAVAGTVVDANHQASSSGTLVIGKGTGSILLGSLSPTYDGSAHAATATTVPAGLTVSFTYDGGATAPTDAGSYAVVGTLVDANYAGSATGALVIGKATATVTLASLAQTYDGTPRVATATTVPPGLGVTFTYAGSATAPTASGSYAVVGTVADANHQGQGSGTLVVGAAGAALVLGDLDQTYDGTPRPVSVVTTPAGLAVTVTYDGGATPPTNAGSYAVVATIDDPDHAGSASGTLVVGKATAPVSLGALAQTYDGTARAATVTTVPAGLTVALTYDGGATAPTAAGSYAVVGTVQDANYQGSASGALVVGKATASVTLGALAQTYDGTARAATAATVPAGLTVALTYDGGATAPVGAGTYAVAGTVEDANHQGSASGALVVGKATATVTLSSLEQTYDGAAHPVSVTTAPAGLTVALTYGGSPTAPTAAGSYGVDGAIQDANYQGESSGTLVVAKASATVELGALTQGFDGTPRAVTATTVPAGLTVALTYDGSPSAPTAAGTYAVVGAVDDPNYEGSGSGSLVVGQATAAVVLDGLVQTYDGTPRAVVATTVPAGLTVSVTYDGSATIPVGAGSYEVVATIVDGNQQGSTTGTLVVGKAAATVTLASLEQTYDGAARAATATTEPEGLAVTFTYDGGATAPVGAGSYAVVATVDDANHQGSAAGTLTVAKAAATVTLASLAQAYDGTPRAATASTDPAGLTVTFTYDGSATAPTETGSYAVVGTIADPNHQGSASGTLVVSTANATVTLAGLAQTYDGTPRAATATTSPAGLTVTFTYDGSATAPTAAGSYAVVATIESAGYQGTASGTLVVAKAAATVTLAGLARTYDGTPVAATATTVPAGLSVGFTYDGGATAPTAAGTYAVVATVTDANHTGTASGTLVVAKATATVTLAGLTQPWDGTPRAVTATTAPAGLTVDVTYDGSATAPSAPGSYAVVATVRDANHDGSATGTLVVERAAASVAVQSSRPVSRRGRPITFTATVTAPHGSPGGSVTFKTGSTELGSATLTGGAASITVRSLTKHATAWPITAEYAGDASFAAATGDLAGGQVVENTPPVAGAGTSLLLGAAAADLATVQVAGALDASPLTLEAWLKPGWTSAADARGAAPTVFSLGGAGAVRLALGVQPDLSALTLTVAGETRAVPATLASQAWHHVAVVVGASSLELFLDGESLGTFAGTAAGAGDALVLGQAFAGELDEVRAWSVARTAGALLDALQRPLRGDEAGLLGCWRMDEGSGAELFDASSQELDGAVTLTAPEASAFAPSAAFAHRSTTQDHALAAIDAGYDADGDALTLAIASPAQHGTATPDADALQVGYQPAAGWVGADGFTFSLDDGSGPVSYALDVDVTEVLACRASSDCASGELCVYGQCKAQGQVHAESGGCGSSGSGPGGAAALLALVALGLLRRSPRAARAAVVLAAAFAAGVAQAGTPAGFVLQPLEPTPPGDGFLVAPDASAQGHLAPAFSLTGGWSGRSLVLVDEGGTAVPGGTLVDKQLWSWLGVSLPIRGRLLVEASLPIALSQSGARPLTELPEVGSTGLGDLRLGARVAVVSSRHLTLAAGVSAWLPTGSREAFASDGSTRLEPRLLASGAAGPFTYAASAGYLVRKRQDLGYVDVGNALTYTAALGWNRGAWMVGPELFGRTQLVGSKASPIEGLLGVRYAPRTWNVGVGIGTSLDRAVGGSPLKVVAQLGWHTQRPETAYQVAERQERERVAVKRVADAAAAKAEAERRAAAKLAAAQAEAERVAALRDGDGDGIPDRQDACPEQNGIASAEPAKHGCPENDTVVVTAKVLEALKPILLAPGRDAIAAESEGMLMDMATALKNRPGITKVLIEGHTDTSGGKALNDRLSKQRAEAVRTWLIRKGGVEASRLQAKGFGSAHPIATNATPEGRAQNRRVVFTILEQR